MDEATQSYRERMKAQRADARAKRDADKAAWHRRIELHAEVRLIALAAVKATIRDRGDKLSLYSPAQLRAQADAMIGPWLVAQARARIAERNSQDLHSERSAAPQALPLCETHDRNGAGK
jgi:hypothetical protein